MRRLTVAILTLALGACQQATIGPRSAGGVLAGYMPLRGSAWIDAWIKPDTPLAAELRTVEPPVRCDNNIEDERHMTGAGFWAGEAWTEEGGAWRETLSDTLQIRIKLFDSPKPFLTVEGLERDGGGAQLDGFEPLPLKRALTIDGNEIRVEVQVAPRAGTPDHLVCVGAVDVTTRATWAWICRPTDAAAALATAERIIAEDVPAVRFWRTGQWNAPL